MHKQKTETQKFGVTYTEKQAKYEFIHVKWTGD